jgi:hypothetical protein
MTLKSSITNDVSAIFLNTDDFAETIVYFFRAGGSVSINAIVDRDPPAIYDAGGNIVLPAFTIEIADSSSSGVAKSAIDTGGDEVELMAEFGDVAVTRVTVVQEISGDFNGMIQLALK